MSKDKIKRRLVFIFEPLIVGFLIFPNLIIFWQSGWNFMIEWLESPTGAHPIILPLFHILSQFILLCIYLNQDNLYKYIKHKSKYLSRTILQLHSLLTALAYVIQWVTMWTLCDYYSTDDTSTMLYISIISVLLVILIAGHPSDLVCAPFIISYDSIEYNIRIETAFVVEKV